MKSPFASPAIKARIAAEVARIQSAVLAWSAESTKGELDTKIVQTLADTLDAHARAYLSAVERQDLIANITMCCAELGSPRSETSRSGVFCRFRIANRLRTRAQSSAAYTLRMTSLTAASHTKKSIDHAILSEGMPIFNPEGVTKAFGPIPQDTDQAAWVERTQLCARYLPRIGATVGDARKVIIRKLVGKLFDSWAKRRIDLVKTQNDLRAFSSEMETYLSMIVMPCLSEVDLNDSEVEAIRLLVAGRKQDWLGQAVEQASNARSESTAKAGGPTDRRAAIDTFIVKIARAGRKITRKDIWRSAGYADPTEFQRFQRGDAKVTKSAIRAFDRILAMSPDRFIRILKKKSFAT